ncbi:cupredoxin domain-containing protein [Pallidibacillus thermolactis]|uniref:cupredoxin domain-containing protein n=2 Tax=Pallidibacillus thermolactis TaxID=251051 RepID=UPI0021D8534D|nr:cupredoxin domain-containing protein [Pallidibacillus thermolactis]
MILCVVAAFIWYNFQMKVVPVSNENQTNREIQMITGEFVTETADGKKIEVYRFDPGTIYLKKGEEVDLKILGVNGDEHTFLIENTDIKGRIEKGKETIVPLQFDKPGTYRLICITHKDKKIKRITDL